MSHLLFIRLNDYVILHCRMDIEGIRNLCNALPHVTEDIKWGDDLCFMIGEKMFCVASLSPRLKVSFKVPDEEFEELAIKPGVIPAPYVARYKWLLVENITVFSKSQWEHYLTQSYHLVKVKLSKKVLRELNG